MTRCAFFADAVPLVVAIARQLNALVGHRPRLCIVGPTEEELRANATPGADFINERTDRVVAVPERMQLKASFQEFAAFVYDEKSEDFGEHGPLGGTTYLTIVVIPPDTIVDATGSPLANLLCQRNTDPGLGFLAASAFTSPGLSSILISPSQSLHSTGSNVLCSAMLERASSERVLSRADLLSPATTISWNTDDPLTGADRGRAVARFQEKVWADGRVRGGFPVFNWCFRLPSSSTLKVLGLLNHIQHLDNRPFAMHARDFGPGNYLRFCGDEVFARSIVLIANGEGDRSEDDEFIPMGQIFQSGGGWNVSARDRAPQDTCTEVLGFPMVRLGDKCLIEAQPTAKTVEACLWLCREGRQTGKVQRDRPASLTGWIAITSVDSDFLYHTLRHPSIEIVLRCRGFGSYHSPRISPTTIASLRIPWPNDTTRSRMVADHEHRVTLAQQAAAQATDVSLHLDHFASWMQAGSIWNDVDTSDVEQSLDSLVRLVAHIGAGASEHGRTPAWPAIIAIRRRMARAATDPLARSELAFDVGEAILKYDTALLLALIHRLSPRDLPSLVAKAKQARGAAEWKLSLGHWCALHREARRHICKQASLFHSNYPPAARLVSQITDPESASMDQEFDELVRLRNMRRHSGATPSSTLAKSLSVQIETINEAVAKKLDYLAKHLLFKLLRVDRFRDHTSISRLLLVHDNPLFETQDITRTATTGFNDLHVGEVYVDLNHNDACLSLWPWIVCDEGGDSHHTTCWLFDGVSTKGVEYTSPITGNKQVREADVESVRKLCF